MKIIVAGGRNNSNAKAVWDWLDQLVSAHRTWRQTSPEEDLTIVQGGAGGVDKAARDWAARRGVPFVSYPYPPNTGRAGGPIRNLHMLRAERPEIVVVFPGGRGTRNMALQAEEQGVPVIKAGIENA